MATQSSTIADICKETAHTVKILIDGYCHDGLNLAEALLLLIFAYFFNDFWTNDGYFVTQTPFCKSYNNLTVQFNNLTIDLETHPNGVDNRFLFLHLTINVDTSNKTGKGKGKQNEYEIWHRRHTRVVTPRHSFKIIYEINNKSQAFMVSALPNPTDRIIGSNTFEGAVEITNNPRRFAVHWNKSKYRRKIKVDDLNDYYPFASFAIKIEETTSKHDMTNFAHFVGFKECIAKEIADILPDICVLHKILETHKKVWKKQEYLRKKLKCIQEKYFDEYYEEREHFYNLAYQFIFKFYENFKFYQIDDADVYQFN